MIGFNLFLIPLILFDETQPLCYHDFRLKDVNKMEQKRRFISIKRKFLVYFLALSTLPPLLFGSIVGVFSINMLKSNSEVFANFAIDRINSETETIMRNASVIANMVANDNSIQQIIREDLPASISQKYSIDLLLDSRLDDIQQQSANIFSIYLICKNGGVYRSTFHTIKENVDFLSTGWYKKVTSSGHEVWFEPHIGSYVTQTVDTPLLSVGVNIIDKATGNSLGVAMVDIELSVIQYIYDKGFLKKGYTLLLNDQNQAIVYPRDTQYHEKQELNRLIQYRPNEYMYTEKKSSISGFTTIGIIPYSEITADASEIFTIVIVLTAFIGILSLVLSIRFSDKFSKPIIKLHKLMTHATTGNLDVQMDITSNDEVGILSEKFNYMIREISRYTSKEIDDLKKLQISELNALQAQINPHFLYNTLDSIVWTARAGDTEKVIVMVSALTDFFRVSLSKGKDIITIKEEMQHIDSYLLIQSMRYASKMEYEINVPEKYYQYHTIKLLLQPLVENAIYHGIKLVERKGKITLSITEDSDNIYIHIDDTGLGMSQEKLDILNKACKECEGESIDSYGVINVCKRMTIIFGPDYYLQYKSEYGSGTRVTVPIPKHLKGDKH